MLQTPLINQLRKKLNEIEYEVTTNFDIDRAKTLAHIQEIIEKRAINGSYPSQEITEDDIHSLLIKNL